MDKIAEAHRIPPMTALPARALILLIDAYRFLLSPLLGRNCRFHPTCSHYAREAILVHGAWRGGWLAIRRIGRCHPLAAGGIDEVPPASTPPPQPLAAERNH